VTEREWREASDLRVSRIGLAAVLATAAVLRFWALGHGIPYSVGVDEPEIVERAFNMMRSGSLNPHFFDFPTLYIYVQLVVSIVRFVAGAIGGAWQSLDQATTPSFYFWGRAVTATLGVATVFVTFHAGLRWGGRHALLAAGLLAVMPLHVTYSHYVLPDTPLVFFTTLTLLLSLVAHEKNTMGAFALAGVTAGLAASTKYNGAVALLMPIVACWMTVPSGSTRLTRILVTALASLAAFVATSPYALLDLPQSLNAFARITGDYRLNPPPADAVWILYLTHLRLTFGWPAVLLAGAGLLLGLVRFVRGPGHLRWALIVIFTAVYFTIVARQNAVFARYLLPIVPMLCLAAACAVVSGVSLLRRYEIPRAPRTALIAALTIAALLPPAIQAIQFDRMVAKQGTADLAYAWINANIPKASSVVLESRTILLPPGLYRSRNITNLRTEKYEDYVAEGVEYIVASSQCYGAYFDAPQNFPTEYAEYLAMFERMHELVRYTPSADHPGPELRIFRIPQSLIPHP